MKELSSGDIIAVGNNYYVLMPIGNGAFRFYGVGGNPFTITDADLFGLGKYEVIGNVKSGRGMRSRFIAFLDKYYAKSKKEKLVWQ